MEQKEYTISIKNIEEIVHRKIFEYRDISTVGGNVISGECLINDEYVIIFNRDFPIGSIECEKEPKVEFEDGVVRVVSYELGKILSALDSKVYNR